MRQVVLDTETTGLDPAQGHRIIEVGGVELVNRRHTGRHFHRYLNPDRDIDAGAQDVHGITSEFLADKPRFPDVVVELLDFLRGAELIIHNAPFDVAFLNAELELIHDQPSDIKTICRITDSLALARQKHPGQRNSLDALCRRYSVDNSVRKLHGALLDAEILADVYLLLTGGQTGLFGGENDGIDTQSPEFQLVVRSSGALEVVRASPAELQAHETMLNLMEETTGQRPLFRELL